MEAFRSNWRAVKVQAAGDLLNHSIAGFAADERIKYGEHPGAVFQDPVKQRTLLGKHMPIPTPLLDHLDRHADVAPQLLDRVSTQEQTIEKGRLPLRESELSILLEIDPRRCHRK